MACRAAVPGTGRDSNAIMHRTGAWRSRPRPAPNLVFRASRHEHRVAPCPLDDRVPADDAQRVGRTVDRRSQNSPLRHEGRFYQSPNCYDVSARRCSREGADMALELRPNCELCDRDLPPASTLARICSYECTFCVDCVQGTLANVCPNCGGGFVPRPIRPAVEWRSGVSLRTRPASGKRVHCAFTLE